MAKIPNLVDFQTAITQMVDVYGVLQRPIANAKAKGRDYVSFNIAEHEITCRHFLSLLEILTTYGHIHRHGAAQETIMEATIDTKLNRMAREVLEQVKRCTREAIAENNKAKQAA